VAPTPAPSSSKPADPAATKDADSAADYTRLEQAGKALSITSTVVNGVDAIGGAALNAVASAQQPDGSWVLKDTLGPVSLTDPSLKRVLSKCTFGVSRLLQVSDGGKVVVMVLQNLYEMYNCSSRKATWVAEFMLYLKRQEHELLSGQKAFERQGFFDRVAEELKRVGELLRAIHARAALASFLFALTDQESLEQSKVALENLKSQALQGMFVEVAEGQQQLGRRVKELTDKLEAAEKKAAGNGGGHDDASRAILASMRAVQAQRQLDVLLQPLGAADALQRVEAMAASFIIPPPSGNGAAAAAEPATTTASLLADFEAWSTFKPADAAAVAASERVFLLTGPSKTGKSALLAHVALGHAVAAGAAADCVAAVHFRWAAHELKQQVQQQASDADDDDGVAATLARRHDARAVVKNLLFQLLQRLPVMRAWVLARLDEPFHPPPPPGNAADSVSGSNKSPTLKETLARNNADARTLFLELIVKGLCHVNKEAVQARKAAAAAAAAASGPAAVDDDAARGILPDCVVPEFAPPLCGGADASGSEAVAAPVPRKFLLLVDGLDHPTSLSDEEEEENEDGDGADDADEGELVHLLSDRKLLAPLPPWVGLLLSARAEKAKVKAALAQHGPAAERKAAPLGVGGAGSASSAAAGAGDTPAVEQSAPAATAAAIVVLPEAGGPGGMAAPPEPANATVPAQA
jgi:hypothetical protein